MMEALAVCVIMLACTYFLSASLIIVSENISGAIRGDEEDWEDWKHPISPVFTATVLENVEEGEIFFKSVGGDQWVIEKHGEDTKCNNLYSGETEYMDPRMVVFV